MSAAITAVVQTSAAGVAAELERLAQELAKVALAEVREACGAVSEETAAFIAARSCEEASAMYARAVESVTDLPFTLLASTADHVAEYEGGTLTIIRRADGLGFAMTGKGIAGQFRDCLRTHAPEKVIETFIRMAGPGVQWVGPFYKAGRMPAPMATPGRIDPATGYDRRDASPEASAAYVRAATAALRSV